MMDRQARQACGPIVPLKRLIGLPGDRLLAAAAQKQCSYGSMCDDGDIPAVMACQNSIERATDALLRIDSPLPTANALLRVCKEGVCNLFELRRRQKAGGTPVVLAKIVVDRHTDAEAGSQNSGGFDGFGLCAGPDGSHVGDDRAFSESPHPRQPDIAQSPALNGNKRINRYLWMRNEDQARHAGNHCMVNACFPPSVGDWRATKLSRSGLRVRSGVPPCAASCARPDGVGARHRSFADRAHQRVAAHPGRPSRLGGRMMRCRQVRRLRAGRGTRRAPALRPGPAPGRAWP